MIRSRSVGKILDISENALAMAGYTVLDGDHESVVIRDKAGYNDYKITVEEIVPVNLELDTMEIDGTIIKF